MEQNKTSIEIKKDNNYRKIDDCPQSIWNSCNHCQFAMFLTPYMNRCLLLNGGKIEDKKASVRLDFVCDKFKSILR